MKRKIPELIAPAGDWDSLSSAIDAGCDSIYFGVKGLNMRHGAGNFDILEVSKVMEFVHQKNKKGYLALNIIVYEGELERIRKLLAEAKKAKVDAVILWDMAVLSVAKEMGLKIHLSTQASVSNFEAFKHYARLGAERIVLARECSLSDIENIASKAFEENTACRIETFIHGAMCVSISGRCFLSQHSFKKSANRGECIQPCRREYRITDTDGECEYVLGEDHVLSAKDLCTVEFIDKLIETGIDAFKIEGRMRSPEYVSVVTSAYRTAIDAFFEGKLGDKLKSELLNTLRGVFNRGFTDGFFFGSPGDLGGRVRKGYQKIYLGEVLKFYKKINVAEIMVNGSDLNAGDEMLITGKKTPAGFLKVSEMQIEHNEVEHVDKGNKAGVKIPFEVRSKDKVFLWRKK